MDDITSIIIEYADDFEMLKFSEKWMSANCFQLKHGYTMAIKIVEENKWVLPDTEPAKEGKVCWRINVT